MNPVTFQRAVTKFACLLVLSCYANSQNAERPAELVNAMPADAIAYVRLPNLFAGLAPAGRKTDAALSSAAHQAVLESIRKASLPLFNQLGPELSALAQQLDGPIEIAFVAPGGVASPAVSMIVQMPVRSATAGTLRQQFQDASASYKKLQKTTGNSDATARRPATMSTFDADGFAELVIADTALPMQFDRAKRVVRLAYHLPGSNEAAKLLLQEQSAASLAQKTPGAVNNPDTNHVLAAATARLEPSKLGFVMSISTKAFRPLAEMFAMNEALDPVQRTLIQWASEVEVISFGAGSFNGRGQLTLDVQGLPKAWAQAWPQQRMNLDIGSLGEPSSMFAMQLPDPRVLKQWQQSLPDTLKTEAKPPANQTNSADDFSSVDSLRQKMASLGIDPVAILSALGPSMVYATDAAGDNMAFQLRDAAALEREIAKMVKAGTVQRSVFERAGQRIVRLSFPLADTTQALDATAATQSALMAMRLFQATVIYYTVTDNWILVSGLPQPLYGRQRSTTTINDWLVTEQKQDVSRALLAGSAKSHDWGTRAYHGYLSMLQNAASATGATIDIAAMPSAHELGVPRDGAVGYSIDRTEQGMAIRSHYENSPVELLGNAGGLSTVSAVAILAAIAIPAYQDYVIRARLSSVLAALAPLKVEVAEESALEGKFASQLSRSAYSVEHEQVEGVLYEDGVITVLFNDKTTQLGGKKLTLTACIDGENSATILGWACGSAQCDAGLRAKTPDMTLADDTIVANKYLPKDCRE